MILLICEKRSFFDMLADANVLPAECDVIHTLGMGLWRYELPKVGFTDIPFTHSPKHLRAVKHALPVWTFCDRNKNALAQRSEDVDQATWLGQIVSALQERAPLYDEIVLFIDPDRRGSFAARQILDVLSKHRELPPIHSLRPLEGLHRNYLVKQWHSRQERPWEPRSMESTWAEQQEIKQLFEFWWSANASVVFSELCAFLHIAANPIISKYEIMMYFLVHEHQGISLGKLIRIMSDWKGSGAYDKRDVGIGSASSQAAIIEQGIQRGILGGDDGTLAVTDKGRLFLDALHPKTWDPDLPFRLENWMVSRDVDSMKKYIRTVFGRQLRFQRRWMNAAKKP